MFRLARTFAAPASPANAVRGFPAPGAGDQTTGPAKKPHQQVARLPIFQAAGTRSWSRPDLPQSLSRGQPIPENAAQHRPPGALQTPPMFGGVSYLETPFYDRGAEAFTPNFGKVLANPIGAGVQVLNRTQASYGSAGQYQNGAIWWTSQEIPTSTNLTGLSDPEEIQALVGDINVYAVVRTTG